MTKLVRDNRGRGSRWRDQATGRWIAGPLPKEGTSPKQDFFFDVPDFENPPEIEGYDWLVTFTIEGLIRDKYED